MEYILEAVCVDYIVVQSGIMHCGPTIEHLPGPVLGLR
jgi:hypothetical protein